MQNSHFIVATELYCIGAGNKMRLGVFQVKINETWHSENENVKQNADTLANCNVKNASLHSNTREYPSTNFVI